MTSNRAISPILLLMIGAIAFELFFRLPYVLFVARSPVAGAQVHMHFFSHYDHATVIGIGLTMLALAVLALGLALLVSPTIYRLNPNGLSLPMIPKGVYIVGVLVLLSAFLSVALLGPQALTESVSSKRSELGERGIVWVLLKVAIFGHFVACLFYIRSIQTGFLIDKLFFWALVATLLVTTVVFSQRAILISLAIEMLYLQLLLGTFKLRRILILFGLILAVVIAIAALRPGVEFYSFWEGVLFGLERIVVSRYFFDFAKLGAVMAWAESTAWLGPVSITFLFEPFIGDQVLFYKELGPLLSSEVYLYRHAHGVTPGAFLEGLLSFGILGGVIFFTLVLVTFFRIEATILKSERLSIVKLTFALLIISKFSIFLNSSLGAFSFQLALEAVLAVLILPFVTAVKRRAPQTLPRPAAA